MSTTANQIFLEDKYQAFREALDQQYWRDADKVINLVEDSGFSNEAYEMRRELFEAQALV